VCFAPDGKTVAVATSAGKVRLFDRDGKPLEVFTAEETGLTNVALSPDGAMVVAVVYVLWLGYTIYFEVKWNGQTPASPRSASGCYRRAARRSISAPRACETC
jgi:WD40 repeat protein